MDLTMAIQVQLLLFASAREAAGNISQVPDLELPDDCDTQQLRTLLAERYPGLARMVLDEKSITLALNEEYLVPGQVVKLRPGDTVALIPPISGG